MGRIQQTKAEKKEVRAYLEKNPPQKLVPTKRGIIFAYLWWSVAGWLTGLMLERLVYR